MQYALLALGLTASVFAQGVTEKIAPKASAPGGCSMSYDGGFEISVRSFGKRDLEKRECSGEGALVLKLNDGVLLDGKARTGYIADNYQFQFDKPAQTGAIYTAGFSTCSNGSLALGGSAVFYQCLSGSFYNLYDRHWAPQCEPVVLQIVPCGGAGMAPGAGMGSGNKAGGVYTTTAVNQIGDGQPQVIQTVVTQIGDGQIQAPTAVISQINDGQIQAPTAQPMAPVVSQIGDGQIQAPSGKAPVVSQIGDGQIQAPSGAPKAPKAPVVSQIGDGQIQAPTAVVSQIGDGQIQAPTAAPKPPVVSQIGDGQIQAPTGSAPVVTQIGDGQIQAPPAATTPAQVVGAAPKAVPGAMAAVVAMVGLVFYL